MPNWPYTHTVKLLSMKTRFFFKAQSGQILCQVLSANCILQMQEIGLKGNFKYTESRFETFYLINLTASSSSTVKVEVTFKKTMSKEFAAKSPATFFTSLTVSVICAVAEKYFWTESVRKYLVASATSKMSSRS